MYYIDCLYYESPGDIEDEDSKAKRPKPKPSEPRPGGSGIKGEPSQVPQGEGYCR